MGKPTNSDGNFDLVQFRRFLRLMEKYGVTEASLTKNGEAWKVRRGPRQVAVMPEMAMPQQAAPSVAAAPQSAGAVPSAPAAKGITIDSPTVGTFYSSPTPEEPAFVSVGSVVGPETVVCIIEAMKVFNQIPAEKSGRVVEILVENGDAVEFGQPLFRIEPA